ncbi:hypothetical protein KC316_g5149 [Hortaea werneckii]|nr:hypothetical protein KC324_g10080 [Hortaea werneckii]KAI7587261.1 hypothetical protein KC316_g5149 [Hortaea werneckii]
MPARMEKEKISITAAYPIELHYIKALFLQRRYRQCIETCRHVLLTSGDETAEHAMQVAFANFYLGLAHDELARLMHDFSHAKVPALDQAEQFFRDALRSLPSAEELAFTLRERQTSVHERNQATDDPFSLSLGAHLPAIQRTTRRDSNDYDPYNYYSPTIGLASPIDAGRVEDKLPCAPQPVSQETSGSDLTDLESHSSFNQIMTPHRVLERDLSPQSTIQSPFAALRRRHKPILSSIAAEARNRRSRSRIRFNCLPGIS